MKKAELLLPAGNIDCLRAAVANGADAVYLGLSKFNARMPAYNFDEKNIKSIVDYCHERKVRVYVAMNTLVKNSELEDYFRLVGVIAGAGADAVIIQDACFAPFIKKNFSDLHVHLSTQATVTNSYSIPDSIDRVIPAREISLDQIRKIAQKIETEAFVHGALCFSYSGQCLFSSIVGGRSGNRGQCAQPCRRRYNGKYSISTKDLCLVERIPELIKAGVLSFKVEGRLRSPRYVGTVAGIYRKYIDLYYSGKKYDVEPVDIDLLKVAFSREFTQGFAFEDSIVDPRMPMNRGLYVGRTKDNCVVLKKKISAGDGIALWDGEKSSGFTVKSVKKVGDSKFDIGLIKVKDNILVFKTSAAGMKINLGDNIKIKDFKPKIRKIVLPNIRPVVPDYNIRIFARAHNKKSALALDKAGADVIYYDVFKENFDEVFSSVRKSRFFASTPVILDDEDIKKVLALIQKKKPGGVLVGNKGLYYALKDKGFDIHLDYHMNAFNDLDLKCYDGLVMISPELSFDELRSFRNKRFIILVHGDITLMTAKESLRTESFLDEDGRRFKVIKDKDSCRIVNYVQLGLFNLAGRYARAGFRHFFIDTKIDPEKYVRIYRKILTGEHFNDTKISKGYTTGHFKKGVR